MNFDATAELTVDMIMANDSFNKMYQTWSTYSSAFKASFPSVNDLAGFFGKMVASGCSLKEERKAIYEKNGQSAIDELATLMKPVPQVDPNDTSAFVAAVKSIEKKLLGQCDIIMEILNSIKHDAAAFGCNELDICSIVKDTVCTVGFLVQLFGCIG